MKTLRNLLLIAGFTAVSFLIDAAAPAASSDQPHSNHRTGNHTLLYPRPVPVDNLNWLDVIGRQLPAIDNPQAGKWPLVLWNGPDARTLDETDIRLVLSRGLVPTVKFGSDYIAAAKKIQSLGAPVVVLEASSGDWPYDKSDSASETDGLDPGRFDGWRLASEELRHNLLSYREAGVNLNAAWLDYENAPVNLTLDEVTRENTGIPGVVLGDEERFRVFRRQLWSSLLSAYIAAPLREIFPRISITNWVSSISRPDNPLLDWYNRPHPRTGINLFTATNPVAYGIDIAFAYNRPRSGLENQTQVDNIYTHILLRQVSADTYARSKDAPHLDSVPWVGRWVRDIKDHETPIMSRNAYREALRHIWLRGIDAMMVFNPVRKGMEAMAIYEVQDAAEVYREMLTHHELLDKGVVMNTQVPDADGNSVLWSGVRTDTHALIRITSSLPQSGQAKIEIWPGFEISLEAPPGGRTYQFRRN